ncbi:MAG: hypothetical protein GY696_00970 [Gammaproteobacteria bacterium]|nr:hypothetical protein [Gammaproteobacteria bacterium]
METFCAHISPIKTFYVFQKRYQKPDESVDTYFTALLSFYTLLTLHHDDVALRSFLLMSQMVSGCADPRVKEEMRCLGGVFTILLWNES